MDLKNICALGGSFSYVKDNLFQIQKVIDFIDNKMLWLNYIKPSTSILLTKIMITTFPFLFYFKSQRKKNYQKTYRINSQEHYKGGVWIKQRVLKKTFANLNMLFWKCLHKASFSLKMCSVLPRLTGSLILHKFPKSSSVPDRLRPWTSSPGPQFSPEKTFPDLFLVPYPNLLPDSLSCFFGTRPFQCCLIPVLIYSTLS